MKPERIHKVLARAGLGSRREIEGWVADGRVSIDARPAALGDTVTPGQKVCVDGQAVADARLFPSRAPRFLAYNKPAGVICSRRDPEGRPTVFERIPPRFGGRWVSVGRLDFSTLGLLLFTDDGGLAHALTHPSAGIEREYAVRTRGPVDDDTLRRLIKGVQLQDGTARFQAIEESGGRGTNHWYHVIVAEGRNREVRRLWESQGVQVTRLIRVRFGPIVLPRGTKPGHWWPLDAAEVKTLVDALG